MCNIDNNVFPALPIRMGPSITQADPVGILASLNLYRYAQNEPINMMDPDGSRACTSEQEKTCRVSAASVGRNSRVARRLPQTFALRMSTGLRAGVKNRSALRVHPSYCASISFRRPNLTGRAREVTCITGRRIRIRRPVPAITKRAFHLLAALGLIFGEPACLPSAIEWNTSWAMTCGSPVSMLLRRGRNRVARTIFCDPPSLCRVR